MSLNGAIAEAVVLIRADGSTFQSDVVRQGSTAGTRAGSAFGDQFKRRAKATLAVGGAAIFAGVAATLRTGFTEVQDYQAGWAKLRATFKATHTDVGLTAKDMERLASRIERYSGQTDDSIVAAETQLKTFKAVHDQVGKGNDLFTRATKASADMSAQWGGDASQNAIKLGKALNDPIAGATALSKIGVQFSAEQKAQIKTLVEHNNTLRAQKIVLGEVEGQAKGVARAYGQSLPGQIERSKRAWEGISQELATKAAPALLDLAKFIRKDALPALEDLGGWVKDHKTEIEWFAGIFAGLAISVKALRGVRSLQTLLGRGALGGGGGLLGGAVSMAKPVPVYVTNMTPGVGGGGPVPVGGVPGAKGASPIGGLKLLPAAGVGANSDTRTGTDALRAAGISTQDAIDDTRKVTEAQLKEADGLAKVKKLYAEVSASVKNFSGDERAYAEARAEGMRQALKEIGALGHYAGIVGNGIGTDLGRGLIDGLEAQIPHATQAGKLLVSLTAKDMRLAADAHSPSRVTYRLGQDIGDGLIKGMQSKENELRREADHMMGQLSSLRSNAQALASGVSGAVLGDSSILNTPDQTVGGVKRYFRHVLGVDRQFSHRIDRLRGMHLPKGLVNELEQAGPLAAGNLVRQLARANRGDDRAVGHLFREIHQTARRAGQTARQETYDPQIKEVVAQLRHLNERLDNVTAEIRGAEHRQSARTHR